MSAINVKLTTGVIVQQGIPIPGRKGSPRSDLGRSLAKMDVGQSFLTSMNRQTIYSLARYYGVSVSVRAVDNKHFRVWRISEEEANKRKANNNEDRHTVSETQ